MNISLTRYLAIFIGCLAVSGNVASKSFSDPKAFASYYIETYGLVDTKKQAYADRAEIIFHRIQDVAEDPINLSPGLKILDSDGQPWAVALPDGYIMLSRRALEFCYSGVSLEVGDARLAFVLGHELAHLTADDFWHQKIYLSLSGKNNSSSLENIRHVIRTAAGATTFDDEEDWQDIVKRKELQADDAGFMFAALAGYRVDLVFSPLKVKQPKQVDFLKLWVEQTRSSIDELHLAPADRSAFLISRFKLIGSKVELFMSGIRMAHFGRFEDARHFFKHFQQAFPAHEVLNNLGYINLRLARRYMPASKRYRFWLPVILENVPPLVISYRSLGESLPPIAKSYLKKSIRYLEKATKAHKRHLESRVNLATSYLYDNQPHQARAIIEQARLIAPNSIQVAELRALIIYEQEKEIDMWPTAVKLLKDLSKHNRASTWFNLARLYEERNRHKQARKYWKKTIDTQHWLPEKFLTIACDKLKASSSCKHATISSNVTVPVQTFLRTGDSIDVEKSKKYLSNWTHQTEEIGPLPVDLFISANGDNYLAVDYRLTVAVVKNHSFKSTDDLLRCCGKPMATQKIGNSEIWSYGLKWSALVVDNKVAEFWINDSDNIEN